MVSLILKDVSFSYEMKNNSNSLRAALINSIFRKKNQKNKNFEVIKSININLNEGDSLGIIGRNGSGKSTLLRLCGGILIPDRGYIKASGSMASILSFSCGLNKDLLGIENIKLCYAFNYGELPKNEIIKWIIDFSELNEAIFQRVSSYSNGMIARLAFSIAICKNPEILIMDEVMGAGDKEFIKKAKRRIEYLIEQSGIIIFASHDLNLIKSYCNKFIKMKNGKIIERGFTKNL